MSSQYRSGTASAPQTSLQEALRRCVQQAPVPFAITRGDRHTLVYANAAFCHLAGIASDDALGARVAAVLPAIRRRALSGVLDRAFRAGVEILDERIPAPPGERDWQCSAWPVIGADGRPEALGIEIRESSRLDDVVQLHRDVAEQMLLGALRERGLAEDAEAARRRAAFLAEAGRMLAEAADPASTLVALTKLALPTLDAWCIVDVLEEGNAIHRLGIFHPDPEKQKLAQELEATWAPQADDPFGAPAMLRTQRTVTVTDDIDATIAKVAHGSKNLHILRHLGIGSLLTVPLVARQRLLGSITFVTARRGAPFSREDVQLAEDLAARGALALDNARAHELSLTLRRSAEAANRAKTAFLGAISHELRTPLNAIGGYIELLDMGLRGPVTEAQHSDLARVKANQKHLTLLITEILNFARVGTGSQPFTITEFNACDVLSHAIELVEPLVGQKGLVFDGISGDARVVASADREKVTQILINLLSNAIKFTRPGGHIAAECVASENEAILRVSDTGIGIPHDRLEVIFEPFVQLKEGLADRSGGVGLGLAISRELARAMTGDLTVESTVGRGTRFTLTLPGGSERREV